VLPEELSRLFAAPDPSARDAAWQSFTEMHSHRLLQTARSVHRGYDAAMDAYAHILEELKGEDFRRLRIYKPEPGTRFTTWLTVVARRLCMDRIRQVYGRSTSQEASDQQRVRRQLADLVAIEIDDSDVSSEATGDNPEANLDASESRRAIKAALDELEPGDRLLLALRLEDELGAREIQEMLRLPSPFHVYRRLNHIMRGLRAALDRRGIRGPND
jgi:RNA polymerase sigma factor (sigma-70 family)